ncbi:MAG TPA: biotin attachment protein [Chloroflexi bacterium]|jgi:pyruvate dehydrogenase E2 component (dihydrolipoamide acetyltransferase)|nr:biotin attachment protein [Chloroflexota bacterium]
MGMQEGTIVRWLKAEGDSVDKGEDIVEVESAKVNEMVQSPAAGRIVRLVVAEGDTVPVQAILAELDPA